MIDGFRPQNSISIMKFVYFPVGILLYATQKCNAICVVAFCSMPTLTSYSLCTTILNDDAMQMYIYMLYVGYIYSVFIEAVCSVYVCLLLGTTGCSWPVSIIYVVAEHCTETELIVLCVFALSIDEQSIDVFAMHHHMFIHTEQVLIVCVCVCV